jgi:hypothetical protein
MSNVYAYAVVGCPISEEVMGKHDFIREYVESDHQTGGDGCTAHLSHSGVGRVRAHREGARLMDYAEMKELAPGHWVITYNGYGYGIVPGFIIPSTGRVKIRKPVLITQDRLSRWRNMRCSAETTISVENLLSFPESIQVLLQEERDRFFRS